MASDKEADMNIDHELVFWCARIVIGLCGAGIISVMGLVLYERFVEGKVDVFEAERRTGPEDRRAELPAR
jgi:hypothetical protein